VSYSPADLAQRFAALDDDVLLEHLRNGGLTPEALEVLHEEIARRGLPVPDREDESPAATPEDLGNLYILTRAFDPTEAHLLRGLLESEGIPAFVADGNIVQNNQFLTIAVGFVRVLVPESRFEEALALLKRFRAGEFALSEDVDVGEAEPEGS
jgi:hypothetical protein